MSHPSYTREEWREYQRAWRAKNPGKQRMYSKTYYDKNNRANEYRIKKYGTDGVELFQQQQGLCAICKVDLTSLIPNLRHIDHCHITKKVRGWLCQACNTGIGKFKENPALLDAAKEYLQNAQ